MRGMMTGAMCGLMPLLSGCGGGGAGDDVVAAMPAPPSTSAPTPAPTTAAPQPGATPTSRWTPRVSDTWQWQLSGTIDTRPDVAIYDVDLFDTPRATVTALHAQGRRVLCYFSAGSAENWRPDYARFAAVDLGNPLDGWAGERWLDIRRANVRSIMAARLAEAAGKGCDGVEPDNVDGFEPDNRSGLSFTASDQLDFNRFLATEAHRLNLAIALKNDRAQIPALVGDFDLAVNEQCHEYDECGAYRVFVTAGKPVLNAEYRAGYRTNASGERDRLCIAARSEGLRTLVLPVALDGSFRFACD